jgi:hypothetical protein
MLSYERRHVDTHTVTRNPLNWQHDQHTTQQRQRREKIEGRKSTPPKTINNQAILPIINININYENKNASKDKKQPHKQISTHD